MYDDCDILRPELRFQRNTPRGPDHTYRVTDDYRDHNSKMPTFHFLFLSNFAQHLPDNGRPQKRENDHES